MKPHLPSKSQIRYLEQRVLGDCYTQEYIDDLKRRKPLLEYYRALVRMNSFVNGHEYYERLKRLAAEEGKPSPF